MKHSTTIIRYALTIFMLWGIYGETGVFTTIFAFVMAVYMELNHKQFSKVLTSLEYTRKVLRNFGNGRDPETP